MTMEDTIPVRQGEEINNAALEKYLREKLDGLPDSRLLIEQFSSGASNLTYQLSVGEWQAVLRRPPLGPVAPKAHDMQREYTVLKELHPVFPAAPQPFLYCDDESVIGSPFFIMERRNGVVLNTEFPEGTDVSEELCRKISEKMVDTLVELHTIDYKKTGLVQMTKPDGFMERQVEGWITRYERAKTGEIAGVEQLKNWLMANIPVSREATVIHYDFKLNNTMFSEDFSEVTGLFDWEMTTVGDPLADLGAAMSYWIVKDDPQPLQYAMGKPPVTVMPGFMSREEFVKTYAEKSGRDVSEFHFYLAFAYFKLAVICQQIYYRWKKGQTQDKRFANLDRFVDLLIQQALATALEEG
ncbi:Predicted kinase, aminoglycoside phosphotransferase (APT) family [Salipaludibacillus aurantiacus]|uniref:Predicted kinase, aminoglycoside phosphotransferase (APT) family n=2 Tax=Salipaludibacillus aurantiacus TaxID=1601833 RepID=A0A1H9TWF6_9BACI|nr:Predicted kinase, aminoglycoside phosphotransferase (APT) family [Salipaludibacillus aurantiacus]